MSFVIFFTGVDMRLIASLVTGMVLTSPTYAATFLSSEVSGTITATTASFVPGEVGTPSSAFGGFTHAFEIEAATAIDPLWANNPNVIIAGPTFSGNYSFSAAAGYVINSISLRGGGNWATGIGGGVGATATLSANASNAAGTGVFASGPNLIPLTNGGTWDVQTSTITFAGGVSSVAGNIDFSLTRTGLLSLIAGLDDAGVLGGSLLGATFTQSAEAYLAPTILLSVSPIPEPGEWAMMLAGLGVVGAIARRRNRTM
jgi:PEP-CTERM motif